MTDSVSKNESICYARSVGGGRMMLLNGERQNAWQGPDGRLLLSDVAEARRVLAPMGLDIDLGNPLGQGLYAVVPSVQPAPPPEAPLPVSLPPPPNPLPPEAAVAVPMLASALPAGEPGDLIDRNRLHIAWAAWQWLVANREALRPLFLAPVQAPPPPPSAQPPRPTGKPRR